VYKVKIRRNTMAVNSVGTANKIDFNQQTNQVNEQKKIVVGDNSVQEKGSIQEKTIVDSGESQKFALNSILDNPTNKVNAVNKTGNVTQIASLPDLPPKATADPSNLLQRIKEQTSQEYGIRVTRSALLDGAVPNGTYKQTKIPQPFEQQASRNNTRGRLVSHPAGSNESHDLKVIPLTDLERKVLKKANQLEAEIVSLNRDVKKLNKEISVLQRKLVSDGSVKTEYDTAYAKREALNEQLQSKTAELNKYVNVGQYRNRERLSSSAEYNAEIFTATAAGVNPNAAPVIFVNGVNTDIGRSGIEALELSELAGAPVQHVVNVTDLDHSQRLLEPLVKENIFNSENGLATAIKGLLTNPPAATQTANAILNQLDSGKGIVRVVGYSQGGAIVAEALRHVKGVIQKRLNAGKYTEAEATAFKNRIQILGIAPAAAHRDLDPVFRRNYRIIFDRNDQVVAARGIGENGRTNNIGDLRRIQGITKSPGGLSEHLSYFRHYEKTDASDNRTPRANAVEYDPRARIEINNWFKQPTGGNAIELDVRHPTEYPRREIPEANIRGIGR
jgi:hypothetical protein